MKEYKPNKRHTRRIFDVLYTLFILHSKFRFVLLYSQDFAKLFYYLAKSSRWNCRLMSFTLSKLNFPGK